MRGGALDGLSIGFRAVRASDAASGVRRILEADLWEISVVTFPMLPEARIESVKARRLPTIREFECWLTRDAGLTRGDARTVVAKGFASLLRERDAARGAPGSLAGQIREATRMINGKGNFAHDCNTLPTRRNQGARALRPADAFGEFMTHIRGVQGDQ